MSERAPNARRGTFIRRGVRRLLGRQTRDQDRANITPEAQAAPEAMSLDAHLEAIDRRLDELGEYMRLIPAHAPTGDGLDADGVRQALASLEKQINRAGREQLKANSLVEAQAAQFSAALEALRTGDARRETEIAALREQNRGAQAAGRLEMARAVLPALDGLDEALRSGEQLLGRPPAAPASPAPPTPRFFRRFRARVPAPAGGGGGEMHEAMAAWLTGLTFVRERLLGALAAEDVRPIEAQGQAFNPQLHVAIEVVPASDGLLPGTIVSEVRRGYLVGDRVLRHAEVVVAREQGTPNQG